MRLMIIKSGLKYELLKTKSNLLSVLVELSLIKNSRLAINETNEIFVFEADVRENTSSRFEESHAPHKIGFFLNCSTQLHSMNIVCLLVLRMSVI